MTGFYDYRLVSLSVAIAIFASYTALELAGRVTATRGRWRVMWLTGGAIAMGLGIWSMHYVGMLAFKLPVPVRYDVPTVLLSLLAAISASAVALFVVSRRIMGWVRAAVGSLFMGAGIAAMHYIGMAAMRLPAMHHYNLLLVALSVALAVGISLVALWLAFRVRDEDLSVGWRKVASAVVMGAAIPVMHYTGMAAATFVPGPSPPDSSHAVDISLLGQAAIILITLVVLSFAVLTSRLGQRFSAQARQIQISEQRYQLLFDSSPLPTLVLDLETQLFVAANQAAVLTYGFSAEEFLSMSMTRIHPDGIQDLANNAADLMNEAGQWEHRRKDGTLFPAEVSVRQVSWAGRGACLVLVVDISQRKREEELERQRSSFLEAVARNRPLEGSLRQLSRIVENQSAGGLCTAIVLQEGQVCHVAASTLSEGLVALLEGLDIARAGKSLGLAAQRRLMVFESDLGACASGDELCTFVLSSGFQSCWIVPVLSPEELVLALLVVLFRDARSPLPEDREHLETASRMAAIAIESRRLTDKLSHQAQHDALTGLPNRALLEDRLQQAIVRANRYGSKVALLVVDLDGFKAINDTLGHHAGDQVLMEIARRLRAVSRQTDTVGRTGGDEFLLILTELANTAGSIRIAQACLDAVKSPILLAGVEYSLSASVGLSHYPDDATGAEALRQAADSAMYQAKVGGKNAYRVFA